MEKNSNQNKNNEAIQLCYDIQWDNDKIYSDLYTNMNTNTSKAPAHQSKSEKKKPFFLKRWCQNLVQLSQIMVSYVNEQPDYWQQVQQKRNQDEKIKLSLSEDDIATYHKTQLVKEIDYHLSLAEQAGKALKKNHQLTGIFSGIATLMPFNAIVWIVAACLSHNDNWTLKGIIEIWAMLASANTCLVLSVLHDRYHFSWCEKLLDIIPLFKRHQTDYEKALHQLPLLLANQQVQHEYLTYVDLKLKSYENLAQTWMKQKGISHEDYLRDSIFSGVMEKQTGKHANSDNHYNANQNQDELKTLLEIYYSIRARKESLMQSWSHQNYDAVILNMNELMPFFEQTDNWIATTQKAGLKFENEQKFKQSHEQYKENHLLRDYLKNQAPESNLHLPIEDSPQIARKDNDLDNEKLKKML
jgi:hypothetical protein